MRGAPDGPAGEVALDAEQEGGTVDASLAARLRPVTDDRDTGGFWAGARRGELCLRQCRSCGSFLHLPRAYCRACKSWDTRWQPVSGRGRLYSYTVADHQVHAAFPVPYTIVLVELDDAPGVRLVGSLPGAPELVIGQAMEAWFEPIGGGVVLPQWRPTPA
jgi:uncharacterized OB-fold protein